MTDCIFCKIVKGEVPSNKVYEDDEILAFHDVNPSAPVHILIVPKKHIKNLSNTKPSDSKTLGKIQVVSKNVAKKMGVENSYRLATASGYDAGQRVFHIHYHLTGGWKKKTGEMRDELNKPV